MFIYRSIFLLPLVSLVACLAPTESEHLERSPEALSSTDVILTRVDNTYGFDVGTGAYGECVLGADWSVDHELWCRTNPLSALNAYTGSGAFGVKVDTGAIGPWVINSKNEIYGSLSRGTPLVHLGGAATDVAVSDSGNVVYVLGTAYSSALKGYPVYRWTGDTRNNPWQEVVGAHAVNIDAGDDGTLWATNSTGEVWHIAGTPSSPTYTRIGPSYTVAHDIAVDAAYVWVVGDYNKSYNSNIYFYDKSKNAFTAIPNAVGTRISASSGTLTLINDAHEVWTTVRQVTVPT